MFPIPKDTQNLVLVCEAVSEDRIFEKNGYVHVYSLGAGAVNPLGQFVFFRNINILSIWSFAASISH